MRMSILFLTGCCALCLGCPGIADLYGGGGNGGDTTPPPEGLVNLDSIDFTSDVPSGVDPATLDIGGGSVEFAGGTAGTLGITSLYFDNDRFAWDLAAGSTATITFTDLDVRAVRFYFAHQGDSGATLTAEAATGEVLGTAESFAATQAGDSAAVFEIDAGDSSITRLVIEVPEGAVVALDHLVLSVPE